MAQSPKKRMGIKRVGKTRKNQVKFNKRIQETQEVLRRLSM
jgi:hypothetical protein